MPSTFFGLEIGRRALQTSQTALDVIGQNTSNVNTPGYSRQVVTLDETDPYTPPDFTHIRPGELGTGVTIASINRIRDEFIDRRVYTANSDKGAVDNLRDMLGRIEQAFNEPGNTGIGQLMTDFFNSFADLSANPESGAVRSTVRNRAETLVAAIHSVNTTLSQIKPEIESEVKVKVDDVNTLATQIANLNKQIHLSLAAGDHPNDLMDKRGALMDQLSGLVDIQVTDTRNPDTGNPTGEVQINVGGYGLVQGNTTSPLPATITTAGNALGLITPTNDTIPLRGGQLYGLVKASTLLDGYQSDLDTLVSNLISTVNAQHRVGYGLDGINGRDFFAGTNAATIDLGVPVKNDLNAISAAAPPAPPNPFAPGNGDNARTLAALTSTPIINGFSLDEFYNATVARAGADAHTAGTEADSQEKVLNQLKNQQASVSGVSLDEELTNMLQFQRTYQAAARVINMMDDALNRIINTLGVATAA